MLNKFLQFFAPQLKEYNKRNKGAEKVFGQTELTHLINLMDKLIQYDINNNVGKEELHIRLLSVTDFIHRVSYKSKFKDRYIANFFDDILYFEYISNHHEIDLENIDLTPFESLYNNNEYTSKSIKNHLTLLLSKTVDYIPDTPKQVSNLNNLIDLFNGYKNRLTTFQENGLKWWVYLYTEHVDNIPISLRYLNVYGNLGDKVETWVEEFQSSKMCEMLHKAGYDVFAGWGNLSTKLKLEEATISDPTQTAKEKSEYVHLSENAYRQTCISLHEHTSMYYYDKNFLIVNPTHYELLLRSFAATLWNLIPNKKFHPNTIKSILMTIRNVANKGSVLPLRKDRKLWYTEDWVTLICQYIDEYNKNKVTAHVVSFASHVYDICVPNPNQTVEEEFEVTNKHHEYLAKVLNKMYYSSNMKYSAEEVSYFMQAYQNVIMPKYFLLIDQDKQHLFRSNLEFALNLKDENRVKSAYTQLKGWFEERHSTELNKQFWESNYQYFKYMSYANKELLLNMLNEQPFNLVSYGGSREIYDQIVNVCRQDVETPIMTHRVEDVSIVDGGVVVNS